MNKLVDIAVCYHKPFLILKNDILHPIQLGSSASEFDLKIDRDDIGENISSKHKSYAEETAFYWLWKNSNANFKGLFHYRRLLDLTDHEGRPKVKNIESIADIDLFLKEIGLTEQNVSRIFEKYDVVVQTQETLKTWFNGNIYEHFCTSHNPDTIDAACRFVQDKYPDFYVYFEKYLKSTEGYFQNLCIMHNSDFDEMCNMRFKILSYVENAVDRNIAELSNDWRHSTRYVGFVGERFTGAYIEYLKSKGKKVGEFARIELLPSGKTIDDNSLFYLKNTDKSKTSITINPVFQSDDTITIFSACDQAYVAPCYVFLNSIKSKASPSDKYDIIIGVDNVNSHDIEILQSLNASNFSVRIVDISDLISKYNWHTQGHISKTTYARLFIPEIFSTYKKILYLDCDLIVNSDLSELWNTDISNHYIAACRERLVPTLAYVCPGYNEEFDRYLKDNIGLSNVFNYFNAGVLLFNIDLINRHSLLNELFSIVKSFKQPIYLDQDILNKCYSGKPIYWLGSEWNVQWNVKFDFPFAQGTIPYDLCVKLLESPKIIHYCGSKKPWNYNEFEYSKYFWENAIHSPYFMDLLNRRLKSERQNQKNFLPKYIKYYILNLLTFNKIPIIKKRLSKYFSNI